MHVFRSLGITFEANGHVNIKIYIGVTIEYLLVVTLLLHDLCMHTMFHSKSTRGKQNRVHDIMRSQV